MGGINASTCYEIDTLSDDLGQLRDMHWHLERFEAHWIEVQLRETNGATIELKWNDSRWIGDEFKACRESWGQFQSSWSDDWTIERQFEAFASNWVEFQTNWIEMDKEDGFGIELDAI